MIGTLIEPQDKNSIAAFQKLIPQMIGTLQGFLQNGQEDKASHAMEVFDNLGIINNSYLLYYI